MYRSIASGMILIILSGYFLFAMKREVEALNYSYKSLSKQIKDEKMAINLLKAEFSHLTSPSRLKALSDSHLSLASIKPDKMVSDPLMNQKNMEILAKNTSLKATRTKQWRYKHLGEKNIHRASYKIGNR
jgi:hypothetical protein